MVFNEKAGIEWAGRTLDSHPQIRAWEKLTADIERLIVDSGVDINLLKDVEGDAWFHMELLQKAAKGAGKKFGTKPEQYQRKFKTIDEMLNSGLEWNADWRGIQKKHLQNVYQMSREKNFLDFVKQAGTKAPSAIQTTLDAAKATQTSWKTLGNKILNNKKLSATVLNELKSSNPELASAIERNASSPELSRIISDIRQGHDSVVARLQNELADINRAAIGGAKGVAVKDIKQLEGWEFSKKTADEITNIMFQHPDEFTKGAANISSLVRLFKTGMMDIGYGLINLGIVAFSQPTIFVQAMKDGLEAAVKPGNVSKFTIENAAIIKDMVLRGHMTFGTAEMVEGAGIVGKIPILGEIPKAFGRGFSTSLDVARVYLWRSFAKSGMSTLEAADLGAVIDNITGSLNSAKLGISGYQRMVESAYVSFAPRYRRASVALLSDIFRGGMRGKHARQAMGSFLAAGTMVYTATAKALGVKANLNPDDADFMTLRKGGNTYRLGGPYMTYMRIALRTWKTARDYPDRFITADEGRDTDLLRPIRSQLAPFTGMGWSLLSGYNYMGQPTTDSIEHFMRNIVLDQFSPLTISPLLSEYSNSEQFIAVGAEFAGLITYQDSPQRELNDRLEELSQERYGMSLKDLKKSTDSDKGMYGVRTLYDEPSVVELQSKVKAFEVENKNKTELQQHISEIFGKYDISRRAMSAQLQLAEDRLENKTIDVYQWTAMVKNIAAIYGKANRELFDTYPDVAEELAKPRKSSLTETEQNLAYYAYTDLYGDTSLENLEGGDYWAAFDQLEQKFIDQYGEENYQYAVRTSIVGRNLPPIYKAYRDDIKSIGDSGIWDMSPNEKDAFFRTEKGAQVQGRMFAWGWTSTVTTQDAHDIALQRSQLLGLHRVVPAPTDYMQNQSKLTNLDSEIDRINVALKSRRYVWNEYAGDLQKSLSTITNKIWAYEKELPLASKYGKDEEILNKMSDELKKLETLAVVTQGQDMSDLRMRLIRLKTEKEILRMQQKYSYLTTRYR